MLNWEAVSPASEDTFMKAVSFISTCPPCTQWSWSRSGKERQAECPSGLYLHPAAHEEALTTGFLKTDLPTSHPIFTEMCFMYHKEEKTSWLLSNIEGYVSP